jgi:hypothetical protein
VRWCASSEEASPQANDIKISGVPVREVSGWAVICKLTQTIGFVANVRVTVLRRNRVTAVRILDVPGYSQAGNFSTDSFSQLDLGCLTYRQFSECLKQQIDQACRILAPSSKTDIARAGFACGVFAAHATLGAVWFFWVCIMTGFLAREVLLLGL